MQPQWQLHFWQSEEQNGKTRARRELGFREAFTRHFHVLSAQILFHLSSFAPNQHRQTRTHTHTHGYGLYMNGMCHAPLRCGVWKSNSLILQAMKMLASEKNGRDKTGHRLTYNCTLHTRTHTHTRRVRHTHTHTHRQTQHVGITKMNGSDKNVN